MNRGLTKLFTLAAAAALTVGGVAAYAASRAAPSAGTGDFDPFTKQSTPTVSSASVVVPVVRPPFRPSSRSPFRPPPRTTPAP